MALSVSEGSRSTDVKVPVVQDNAGTCTELVLRAVEPGGPLGVRRAAWFYRLVLPPGSTAWSTAWFYRLRAVTGLYRIVTGLSRIVTGLYRIVTGLSRIVTGLYRDWFVS
ncbi:hypothetical protein NHX12_010318 [Muraenolepis orangiensis]|uniref:Uncharacterized protein n=1 Tax=Muraenolepis orangiensis TaxID=630683 RepID=A0A9Q0DL25_9TELE|nr:hypothetical protein NHX12_010318 [Muraenolepis orangiensis]